MTTSLTIQQMIDQVIANADEGAMAKLAQEAEAQKGGGQKSKEDAERQADKEEAQQGGGNPEGYSEKTASEYVEKLANAVEEVVATLTGQPLPSRVGKIATMSEAASNVGPGKGPGATQTNVESPTSGEQSDVSGEAKTKIPMKPPMESQGSGGNAKAPANAMATNAEMMHPPQPAEGVLKQSSLQLYLHDMAKQAGKGEKVLTWIGKKLPGEGRKATQHAAEYSKATAGQRGFGAAEKFVREEADKAALESGKRYAKGAGITAAIAAPTLTAAEVARRKLKKTAEDAINPAKLAAPKATGLPEDAPSQMARPAEVTSQERLVSSNEAPASATKRDAAAVPKKRMGEVLDEPAQTRATDKVLDEALGSDKVNQAGAKIAAARAWVAKIASEGCSCEKNNLEKGACTFCKVASTVEKKRAEKGSVKTSQVTSPAGAGQAVPPTVQQSSMGGTMAGGAPTPQM